MSLAADLERALALYQEIELFAAHVQSNTLGTIPIPQVGGKLSSLRGDLKNEIDLLQKRCDEEAADDNQPKKGRSGSNLLFFETLWDAAKRSSNLFDIRHRVCTQKLDKPLLAPGQRIIASLGAHMGSKYRHSLIDLITANGHEAVFCDDSDDDAPTGYTIEDDLDIPILKTAKELARAATNHRIRTKPPAVHLVLPRIKLGENVEVDKIVDLCRQIPGLDVFCADNIKPPPELNEDTMDLMYPDPRTSFSEVLNIDTSVIVALTSEFSHTNVAVEDWFDRQRLAHCEQEEKENFLERQVYPIIGGYELVCVREAIETYKHIVDTIGTPGERARAKIILGEDSSKTPAQLLEELQKWSVHTVPSSLRLPVRVVNIESDLKGLPPQAKVVLENQLNPGRSVFTYGWAKKLTTVTCNGVATKQLAHGLEKFSEREGIILDDKVWPSMWAFSSSRPLLGVPKSAGWRKKHIGNCEANGCTCGVEKFHSETNVAAG